MLNALNKLFTTKVPTTNVVGIALTHEEVTQLFQACSTLKQTLDTQLDAICDLPTVQYPGIKATIWLIQAKHLDIETHLSFVVLKTQNSAQSWTHEFADAQTTLDNKIVCINRSSRKIGVIVTALQFWPVVAETYLWLLPLAVRLQSELAKVLKGNEPWTTDIPLQIGSDSDLATNGKQQEPASPSMDRPHVVFRKDVIVREYRIGEAEEGEGEAYCMMLTDDKKRTVGSFKSDKARCV